MGDGVAEGKAGFRVSQCIPHLGVGDLDAAVAHHGALGFAHTWSHPRAAPRMAGVERDGFELVLCLDGPSGPGEVTLVVDDVDGAHAAFVAAAPWTDVAARVPDAPEAARAAPEAPVDRDYGYREFVVVDPWGHVVHVAQKLA